MYTNVSEYRYKSVPPKASEIGDAVWFHELNPRGRDQYGDSGHLVAERRLFIPHDKTLERDIVQKFVTFGGWDPTQRIVVQKITEDEAKEAVERLTLEYERVKSEALESSDGLLQLQVFKHFYLDSKGAIRVPKWLGVTCNRRGSQLLTSYTQIAKTLKGNLAELPTELPMEYPDTKDGRFEHEDHRIIVATRENTVKTEGFKPMTPYDILRMVYKMAVISGRSTGWVERNLGVKGSDRVIYLGWARFIQWCEVEMDWGLRLWERLNPANRFQRDSIGNLVLRNDEPVPNADFIDLKKFNQMAWQGPTAPEHPYCHYAMGAMTDLSKDLDQFNKERERAGKPQVTRPTGPEGRELICNWLDHFNETGGKGVTKKIMLKTDIERLQGTSNKVGRDFVKAIFNNDHNILLEVAKREFCYNHIHDVTDRVYAVMEASYKAIREVNLTEDEQLAVWGQVPTLVARIVAERPVPTEKEPVEAESK